MRTTDALAIGMALGRIKGTLDAWEESKHPRADNGQFSSSPGGGSTKADLKEGRKKWNPANGQKPILKIKRRA